MEDQTIVDYIVQRPWDKIIRIAPDTIINMFSEKGLLDKKFIHSIFSNIFACHPKGITTSVTLLEFYKITNTEIDGDRFEFLVTRDRNLKTKLPVAYASSNKGIILFRLTMKNISEYSVLDEFRRSTNRKYVENL